MRKERKNMNNERTLKSYTIEEIMTMEDDIDDDIIDEIRQVRGLFTDDIYHHFGPLVEEDAFDKHLEALVSLSAATQTLAYITAKYSDSYKEK